MFNSHLNLVLGFFIGGVSRARSTMRASSSPAFSPVAAFALGVALALSACSAAFCSSQPEPFDIGELVIYAEPISPDAEFEALPTSVTVIPREQFDKRFSSVPELLRETAGIEIRSYGGLGAFSSVSVRGSESAHVLVMVDGVALNQAVGGAVDMGAIPLANVERVEVYRGGAPARFQGAAGAGAVNIVTRSGAGKTSAEAAASVGSFGSASLHLFSRMPVRSARASIDFSRLSSDGDFKFLDDNGTPLNAADDVMTPRVNNDFAADNLDLKLELFPGGDARRVSFSNQSYLKDQGVPGLGNFQSELARLKTFRNLFAVSVEDKGALIPGAISTFRLSSSMNRTRFSDPASQIGLGSQDNRNTTRSNTFFSAFEFFPAENHAATAALSASAESFKPFDARQANQVGKPSRRSSLSIVLEDNVSLLDEKLLIVPSFRVERVSNRFSGDDPFDFSSLAPARSTTDTMSAFRAGARFNVSDSFMLKANAGRHFRAPSFYELFGDRGSVIGNTSLSPEKGTTSDIGFSWSVEKGGGGATALFEASYFSNSVRNLISFMQNSQRVARADNIGRAPMRGFELSVSATLSRSWSLTANHTYQNTRDKSDVAFWRGNMLPGRREREFNSKLTFERSPWKTWHQFNRSGAGFHDRANVNPIPSGNVHGAGVSYTFKNSTVTIEGKNLTDNRVSDYIGFPLPGRALFLTFQKNVK